MKYKILIVLLIILNPFTISFALSEKIYFSCDNIRTGGNTKFKYEKTMIFKNFYEEQNGDWVNVDDWGIEANFREDRIILDGYKHNSCSSVCKLRHVLPTLTFNNNKTINATTIIQNDCSYNFDNYGCKKIYKGDVLKKSKCSILFK